MFSVLIAVGLSGRGCQGGEQCGGGDGHEPSRKDHFSAHRPPPHKLPAYGTVAPGPDLRPAGRGRGLTQLFPSLSQVSLGEFELKAPVTIRLKAGTGPITVSGLHLIGNIFCYKPEEKLSLCIDFHKYM